MKQCAPNPWEEFTATHTKGERITGKIKSITDFGVFIGLEGDIDGLIHLSDLSWDEAGEEMARQYKKGDELTAVVLSVDPERERISLGVKQAIQDPFSAYAASHPKGSVVTGVVEDIEQKSGVTVRLSEGVEGVLRVADLSRDHSGDLQTALPIGSELEAKITSIDRKTRKISLSVKALEVQMEGQAIQDYASTSGIPTTTLGEKLKEQLSMQESPEEPTEVE